MTNKTRYFLFGSAGTMVVGLCTGLVAYYAGFPTIALSRQGPDELQYVPGNATVVAYANVKDVMASELRRRIKEYAPEKQADGQEAFRRETGIDIENDIDRVVACATADSTAGGNIGLGLVLASGRFNDTQLETLARDKGAVVEEYRGKRVLTITEQHGTRPHTLALAFMSPGLIGLGSSDLVKHAIDIQTGDAKDSIANNEELMALVNDMDDGNAWAVGRFDTLTARANLPSEIAMRLPAITWFAASGHVNGGITGRLRAEARDEESANNLREVIRGFMALARMQAGSNPQVQAMMQSLELGGTGKTVQLGFSVPIEVLDMLAPRKPGVELEIPKENPRD
jgi:hypothetical protein